MLFKCILPAMFSLAICADAFSQVREINQITVAHGHMPSTTSDKNGSVHIVYGKGDSILHVFTKDGKSFSSPELVAVVPGLFATATRGPQIAAASNGLAITASTKKGNIYSFIKHKADEWSKGTRINDLDENAKEGLMDLSADGLNAYAVWLGVSEPKGQKVYGARSTDGGRTWKKNVVIYTSPSGTVCECCSPSVAIKGNITFVMFRNYLGGNRDLYLIKSTDGGAHFGEAKKLGKGSWKLDGCPMDGGGLTLDNNGSPQTIWRRKSGIYAATAGLPEVEIGEGRSCSIATLNNKNYYAWNQDGNVIMMKPDGIKVNLGPGSLPVLQPLNNEKIICVWENDSKVQAATLSL